MSNEKMYNFIKEHYMFYTNDNYWYSDKSIAKNVKLYNLNLTDWCKGLELLELDNWFRINEMIEDFEKSYWRDIDVYFNGRSGGYLVLVEKDPLVYSFSDYLNNTYEEYLEDRKEYIEYYGYTKRDLTDELKRQYELVKMFDKLCDNLEKEVQFMIDNYEIVEETEMRPYTHKVVKEIGV